MNGTRALRCASLPARGLALVAGAFAAVLTVAPPPAAGVEYYRSDAHGTPLQNLDGDPSAYQGFALAVDSPAEAEAVGLAGRRRLLHRGAAVEEWRHSAADEGSVERHLRDGRLVAERRFDSGGRLLEERLFATDGALQGRAVFTYRGASLRQVHRYDGEGFLLATEDYELTTAGRLRRFTSTPGAAPVAEAPPPEALTFVYHQGQLVEERHRVGGDELIMRFHDGEQYAHERWRGEQVVAERYDGVPDQAAQVDTTVDHTDGTQRETTYDDAGNPVAVRVYDTDPGGEKLLEEHRYRYHDDTTLHSLAVVGAAGREIVDYTFDDTGRLIREQVRRRGRLVRVISYPVPGERVEEVHGTDGTVLRVLWRDGLRMREDFLHDGVLVRTRHLTPNAAADVR